MTRLPFPTWRDLADTLASQDPDKRVTDDDPGFYGGSRNEFSAGSAGLI